MSPARFLSFGSPPWSWVSPSGSNLVGKPSGIVLCVFLVCLEVVTDAALDLVKVRQDYLPQEDGIPAQFRDTKLEKVLINKLPRKDVLFHLFAFIVLGRHDTFRNEINYW